METSHQAFGMVEGVNPDKANCARVSILYPLFPLPTLPAYAASHTAIPFLDCGLEIAILPIAIFEIGTRFERNPKNSFQILQFFPDFARSFSAGFRGPPASGLSRDGLPESQIHPAATNSRPAIPVMGRRRSLRGHVDQLQIGTRGFLNIGRVQFRMQLNRFPVRSE
jgi:hypothetical protein